MKRRYWTMPEIARFRARYPTATIAELMQEFGRSRSATKNMAVKLRLRKSPQLIAQHARWTKSHKTWNKGKPWSPEGSRKTQFKKGHRGARTKPVGAERETRDGVEIKVAEPRRWIAKARYVWEWHNGPVPAGRIVRIKDGNRHNFAPSNLLLITRAEHARLNYRPRKRKAAPSWIAVVAEAAGLG